MTTLKHYNTIQVIRNVFIFDSEVLLIIDHNKNYSIHRLERKVV